MSKIICDVCGTRYPDSSNQCPICGCINSKAGNEPVQQHFQEEMPDMPQRPAVKGGRFSKSNVRKRNQNKPVYDEPETRTKPVVKKEKAKAKPQVEEEIFDLEDEFEEETNKKGGFINVLLVLVIIALLAVSAYIFLQYFMPNFFGKDPVLPNNDPTTVQTTEESTLPEVTDPPVIRCTQLVLDVTDITLYQVGEVLDLGIQALPEGTTDEIMYISSNEAVATVDAKGQVTAVGEGSVVVSAFCGTQHLEINIVCDFDATPSTAGGNESAGSSTVEATETPTEAGEKKTVTSKTLNVRAEANAKSTLVTTYKKGDVITIYEQKKSGSQYWGRTDDGWVCMDYVK